MKQLVSLGNWAGDVYASALASLASGIATGFNAFVAIQGGSSDQAAPSVYFGNTDEATTGWSFRRLADIAADPLTGAPAYVVLAFVVAEATEIVAAVHIPKPLFIKRTFFLGGAFRGDGNDISLYVNGARMQDPTAFAGAFVPGNSTLRFGVTELNSTDRMIGAGYSEENFGNVQPLLDFVHQLAFQNFVHTQAGAAMLDALETTYVSGSAAIPPYIYDAWSQRRPSLTTITPLPNEGSAAGGDLVYGSANVLNVQIDRVPHYTGPTNIPIVIP